MTRTDRQPRHPIAAMLTHGLPAVAALLVLVAGPFVVQCRAPNGTAAAKFLFAACRPEVGCCAECQDDGVAASENPEADSGITACGTGPCGGCAENALFWFVAGRGSRENAGSVGPIPIFLAPLHPASEPTGEIAEPGFADSRLPEAASPSHEIHRVLRI